MKKTADFEIKKVKINTTFNKKHKNKRNFHKNKKTTKPNICYTNATFYLITVKFCNIPTNQITFWFIKYIITKIAFIFFKIDISRNK